MIVYFIRHGESEYNASSVYQPPHAKLSNRGVEQARALAGRFQNIPIDVILSSPFERASATAKIINETIGKELLLEPLLREAKRPSEVVEKSTEHPDATAIYEMIHAHEEEREWRYSDEENFFDLQTRGLRLLRVLEQRSEQNILCVTHGVVLRMILLLMIFGGELTPHIMRRARHFFHHENTGITVCEYEKYESGDLWRLITWNDHAHLG